MSRPAHVPAYADPDFAQSLPKGPAWKLAPEQDRWGALVYRDPATGARAVVPNIWYNQPVAQRVRAMRYYAEQARERVARLSSEPFPKPWQAVTIRREAAQAERLEALAAEMEATGQVLA